MPAEAKLAASNAQKSVAGAALAASCAVEFGREICGDLSAASEREWLVTNGIGGFASGTIAGVLTRRYHGLLIAALNPPLGRTLLVSKLEESASYQGKEFKLSANRWRGGAVEADACKYLERFHLEGTTPVWDFAFADALLEKRVWMQLGANTTCVRYTLKRASGSVHLDARALVNYRDYHSTTHAGDWRMHVQSVKNGLRVSAYDGARPYFLLSDRATAEPAHHWYYNFDLPVARYRGLDDREDHLHAGTFRVTLEPGDSVIIVLTTEESASLDSRAAWESRTQHENSVLSAWSSAQPELAARAPAWIRQLVLAADQFIVRRPLADDPDAVSVIAGYHWFGDWGRDTMIALPGLTLATGRVDVAKKILRTFGRFIDQGMLPNLFPDAGTQPEYNTVDAALWFFEAVRQVVTADKQDGDAFMAEMFPVLADMIEWHLRGTRYNIHANADGLLFAGERGVQLTWMDAKIGDWVVTPRIGKPVEINALWYNALVTMKHFARRLKKPTAAYECLVKKVRDSFQRFWNEQTGYLYDVIDGPGGHDASLRPNQIFAVSLPESPLTPEQQCAVVDACARELLTSHGLRSLAPSHPNYTGHYGGAPRERDAAYHQGTVWAWLLGPFALAHLRVYEDAEAAASFLEPMAHHLRIHGLGSVAEIFDGDAPFTPRGCIAQAWSVAEILRAWSAVQSAL